MSKLTDVTSQFKNLEEKYLSKSDSTMSRLIFLSEMFGIDLEKDDYTSLTELKVYLKQVATEDKEDLDALVSATSMLNVVELLLKNFTGELSNYPDSLMQINDIDSMIVLANSTYANLTRSLPDDYFKKATETVNALSRTIPLTARKASTVKPQKELGLPVGQLLAPTVLLSQDGVLYVELKDKLSQVPSKQFFSFTVTGEAVSLIKSLKTKKDSKSKRIVKSLEHIIENKYQIRNEVFINANADQVVEGEDGKTFNYTIGASKQSTNKYSELIEGLLYRVDDAIPNPLTGKRMSAWLVLN